MVEWYTIKEVSEKTGVPHQSIRRYIDQFDAYIKTKREHKSILVAEESLDVFTKIREAYQKGMKAAEVDKMLKTNIPTTIVIEVEDEKGIMQQNSIGEILQNINQQLQEQKLENRQIRELIAKQTEYIDQRLEKRDQMLMESLRLLQTQNQARIEAESQVAAAIEESKVPEKKGFWSRLFNK